MDDLGAKGRVDGGRRGPAQLVLDLAMQAVGAAAVGDAELKAVEVEIGLDDYKYTELEKGSLKEGRELVTGLKKD
jgi:hypothetical protein